MKHLDQADSPRPNETFETEALERWLHRELEGFKGPLTVKQFRQGHSNLTYLISDGVGEWVLRRPPVGTKVKRAHDMGREHRILSKLHQAYPHAPRALAVCDDLEVIGAPFFVMERLRGVVLRRQPPKDLPLSEDTMRTLSESFIANLVRIHATDLSQAGLADFGRPEGYIQRQVEGWCTRYGGSQTDDVAGIEEVMAWLNTHMPTDQSGCLIHNDYKFDNIMLDAQDITRIVGVLDWEMATVGHPLMDLGTSLALWVQADDSPALRVMQFGPTHLPGAYTRQQIIERYAALSGRDLSEIRFYHAFGLFKMAVVAQQIYYRFATGKTTDRRFAMMIQGVRVLIAEARAIVESSP